MCLVILKEKEYKFRIGSRFHIIFLFKVFQLICILKRKLNTPRNIFLHSFLH